jgi:hypothetical protein
MGAVTLNTNGPRHDSDPASSHVMPALIKKCFDAMHTGEDEIAVWGDGKPTREFLCVDGYAAGDLLVTEKCDNPAAVSIGAGFEITILRGAPPRTSASLAVRRGGVSTLAEQNGSSDSVPGPA